MVHMGRLDGVRNNGGSSNLPWLTWSLLVPESRQASFKLCKPCRRASLFKTYNLDT